MGRPCWGCYLLRDLSSVRAGRCREKGSPLRGGLWNTGRSSSPGLRRPEWREFRTYVPSAGTHMSSPLPRTAGGLTFPAPITFSAAYTAWLHRGQRSEPPIFWANLDALGLVVGLWPGALHEGGRAVRLAGAAWANPAPSPNPPQGQGQQGLEGHVPCHRWTNQGSAQCSLP